MKKSKLLIAAPLMLAPVMAVLPTITSCSKRSDVDLSGDFSKYVNVEATSEQLIEGEPYVCILSVNEDQVGKQYLPNTLTTVKSGDVELWSKEDEEESNSFEDYYRYVPLDNNSRALLYINNVSGKISVEAVTSELKSVSATPIDVTPFGIRTATKAEYEVGETPNNSTHILATATLKNDESFVLTDYTLKLDGIENDHEFKESEISSEDKNGTITFNGITSEKFTFNVIGKTWAWMSYWDGSSSTTKVTKYTNFYGENGTDRANGALTAYLNNALQGEYAISLRSGTYDFGLNSMQIDSAKGKYLTIEPAIDPELNPDGTLKLNVIFKHSSDQSGDSFIYIKGCGSDKSYSNTIRGIQFDEPTATLGSGYEHTDIMLDGSSATYTTNTTISLCKFIGDKDETALKLDAISNSGSKEASIPFLGPQNVTISGCVGQYLNNFYSGSVSHNSEFDRDLTIFGCVIYDSQKLFDLNTDSYANVLIDEVTADLMYTQNETTTSSLSGCMSITDAGTFTFRNCEFNQLRENDDEAAFIECNKYASGGSGVLVPHQISLYKTDFNKFDEESETMHTVINRTGTASKDWNIKVTYDYLKPTYGIAYGDPQTGQSNYWDIDAE